MCVCVCERERERRRDTCIKDTCSCEVVAHSSIRESERESGGGGRRDTCIEDTCRCEVVAHSSVMWENVNLARKAGVSVFVLCTSKESKLSTLSPTTLVTASKFGSGTKDCNVKNVSSK